MKLLWSALALLSAGALACPADDVKDAQASPDKAAVQAKAPVRTTTPTKQAASKKLQSTQVADKSAADVARKTPL
jgi:hypothetical protein